MSGIEKVTDRTLKKRIGDIIPAGAGRVLIMGVLNVTPDSFSDGGKYLDPSKARDRALEMISEGADIIDIGGESSRPGSGRISAEEEERRVIPVVKALRDLKVPLSVDTYKSIIARKAIEEGADIINDITALSGDKEMLGIAASYKIGVILMHMQGTPGQMQKSPEYKDVIGEVKTYLSEAIKKAESAGILPENIVIDPGIGFGKTVRHNLDILKNLDRFKDLGKTILVGVSRKSFLGAVTDRAVDERVFGTIAASVFAITKGAGILRVHDIPEMKDAVLVTNAIMKGHG
ncbi:MAG: dihydropteroate synthase [Candidatus Omnitrophota bacterium]